ncbi:LCI family antimicrobial peptide [Bacillus cereus]|uniref:LCI fold-containing protein n=1 Tax=Bacillus thuringiensis TaxID=1428 RepID=UPI000676D0B0|nr:LCI fold-containing protein [Bacillus thuringiensis]AKR12962.1 lysine 2,3-aminomutase [Bacillus thuringiensis]MBZ8125971.1 lysine 2,3-aminomutase [Bacillus thuringiensis]MDA1926059.1 LCI family antimicrobial peptide [Bacillus cereus]
MFKKLVVGALATGIMLSSAGGAMAATPNTESPKQEKVTMAAEKKTLRVPGFATREEIPNKVVTVIGITWYLKGATKEMDKTWTAYYEGWSN